ncbi:MAG: DUF2147 domain-containing protein [Hyphomicrobiaceae bacterium]|nr:DUF2147 domain-containing protein [Hyphomicrobiaceae bacterium]
MRNHRQIPVNARRTLTAGIAGRAVVVASMAAFAMTMPATAAPREVGVWYDDTGKGAVEIFQCGGKLCGRIFWLKDPLNKKGEPLSDGYNPKAELRNRPICGLQVLGNLQRQDDGTWDAGWVYDPKVGQSYDAALMISGRNNLILTGYKGLKFLSKSFTWTRAPQDLPSCSATTSASR